MEFDNLPGAGPHALFTICASLVDYGDFGFEELNRVFRAHAYAATTKIAFAGDNMDHQWGGTGHSIASRFTT